MNSLFELYVELLIDHALPAELLFNCALHIRSADAFDVRSCSNLFISSG